MPARDSPISFLDGGLGTSLEDNYGVKFSSSTTPLWSSDPLVTSPETLLACQRDFGQVPVDVIETATYQVSATGFGNTKTARWPDGIPSTEIPTFVRDAVDIAHRARGKDDAKVALSLGPYGSTMVPGQEYSGAYDAAHDDEESLRAWWAERLALFAAPEVAAAEGVAYVALETIPRRDEIAAVRRAVAGAGGALAVLPCWIACVFPGDEGRLPDGSSIDEVVKEILAPGANKAQPWGVGINCTKLHKLEGLVDKFESAVGKLVSDGLLADWPALVLYPDGTNGEVYNTTTQKWEMPQKPPISKEVSLGWERPPDGVYPHSRCFGC